MSAEDASLECARPALWGAAGAIVWGASEDTFNNSQCNGPKSLGAYLNSTVGSIMHSAIEDAGKCAAERCHGHGRCVTLPTKHCDCDPGFLERTDCGPKLAEPARTSLKADDVFYIDPVLRAVLPADKGLPSNMDFTVDDDGGLSVSVDQVKFSLVSSFGEAGGKNNSFGAGLTTSDTAAGWTVTVQHHEDGAVEVVGKCTVYTVSRLITPRDGRLLINDTVSVHAAAKVVQGIPATHIVSTGETVNYAVVPGTELPTWCESNLWGGTYGSPTVFMRASSGAGIGMVALDDVFRVHAQAKNYAWNSPLRSPHSDPTGRTHCYISGTDPSIQLLDPHFGIAAGSSYTLEWALYPMIAPSSYWTFINALRADMGVAGKLRLLGTGILNAFNSGFLNVYNKDLGYQVAGGDLVPGESSGWRRNWTWTNEQYKDMLDWNAIHYVTGTIPGADTKTDSCNHSTNYAHGSAFVHNLAPMYEQYFRNLVNYTKSADSKRKVLFYIHTQISTEPGASEKYKDSRVLDETGSQRFYSTCVGKKGTAKVPFLPLFFADGRNSYSKQVEAYVEKAFAMGADGLCESTPSVLVHRD